MSKLSAQTVSPNLHQQVIEQLVRSSPIDGVLAQQQLYALLYTATTISSWHGMTVIDGIQISLKKIKIFLDSLDIHTTYSSAKLSYCHCRSYKVKKQVEPILCRLHLVFLVIKLAATSGNLITRRYSSTPLNLAIIDREEEWEVKKILDSHWHHKRCQYLIKWKGFDLEANFWENTINIFVSDWMVKFHYLNLIAL